MREYSPLPLSRLAPAARLPETDLLERVTLDDPAFSVLTDLTQVTPATIGPDRSIDHANAMMLERRVRLLFVVGGDRFVSGVVTATDLLGEKPMSFVQERGGARSDVLVSDIMTPFERMDAIDMQDVAQMRVGHIVATLKSVRRQHLLAADEGGRRLRGLFSTSRIAKQLGVELTTSDIARTFAEIEAALSH
jgi:CBS domain-containing protein